MKRNKKPQWSTEERSILKRKYAVVPIEELMTLLPGRTLSSIYSQVHYLRKRNWTFGELNFVKRSTAF